MKSLKELVDDAYDTVDSGYYKSFPASGSITRRSLVKSITGKRGNAIVCEIKFASPSAGKIDGRYDQVSQIAKEMEAGGAAGLSVLTEPKNFDGSLENFQTARESSTLPILMKDINVSEDQIAAARNLGASAILFIWEIFSEGYSKLSLHDAIRLARKNQLEIIVETHTNEGLIEAKDLDCDIVGINNRDLKTFKTTVGTTVELLIGNDSANFRNRIIMSESGFESPIDITDMIAKLKVRKAPVPTAFLIGTSIMKSGDIKSKVAEFAEARVD